MAERNHSVIPPAQILLASPGVYRVHPVSGRLPLGTVSRLSVSSEVLRLCGTVPLSSLLAESGERVGVTHQVFH